MYFLRPLPTVFHALPSSPLSAAQFGYTPRADHPRALDECLVSWPDFYTNVPSYYSWIRRELSYRTFSCGGVVAGKGGGGKGRERW